MIASGNLELEPFEAFTVTPDYCTITYLYEVSPEIPATATISFDAVNRVFAIESDDFDTAQIYTVTVKTADHEGTEGTDALTIGSFELEFINPCNVSTLEATTLNFIIDYSIGNGEFLLDLADNF